MYADDLHFVLMDPVHDSILSPDQFSQLRAPEFRHDAPRAGKLLKLLNRREKADDHGLRSG